MVLFIFMVFLSHPPWIFIPPIFYKTLKFTCKLSNLLMSWDWLLIISRSLSLLTVLDYICVMFHSLPTHVRVNFAKSRALKRFWIREKKINLNKHYIPGSWEKCKGHKQLIRSTTVCKIIGNKIIVSWRKPLHRLRHVFSKLQELH